MMLHKQNIYKNKYFINHIVKSVLLEKYIK